MVHIEESDSIKLLNYYEQQLENYHKLLTKRDREIRSLQELVDMKEKYIKTVEERLIEAENTVGDLSEMVNQADSYALQLEMHCDNKVAELSVELETVKTHLNEANNRCMVLQDKLNEAELEKKEFQCKDEVVINKSSNEINNGIVGKEVTVTEQGEVINELLNKMDDQQEVQFGELVVTNSYPSVSDVRENNTGPVSQISNDKLVRDCGEIGSLGHTFHWLGTTNDICGLSDMNGKLYKFIRVPFDQRFNTIVYDKLIQVRSNERSNSRTYSYGVKHSRRVK